MLIAVGLRGLLSLLHFASLFYRNVGWSRWLKLNAKDKDVKTKPKTRRPFGSAKAHAVTYKSIFGHNKSIPGGVKYTHVVEDAIHLHVYPSRSWTFRPGQFVYISLPGLSKTAFAQMHPFYVAWTYKDESDESDAEIAVLIVKKRSGFTKNLIQHALSRRNAELEAHRDRTEIGLSPHSWPMTEFESVVVDGPYGNEIDVQDYGTVVLFATDVGIAGQLPYIEHLLRAHHNWEVKIRRIVLCWQVESEGKSLSQSINNLNLNWRCLVQLAWASDRLMKHLHKDDKESRILEMKFFVSQDPLPFSIETSVVKKVDGSLVPKKTNCAFTWEKTHNSTSWENTGGSDTCEKNRDSHTWEKIAGYTAPENFNGPIASKPPDGANASEEPLENFHSARTGHQKRVEVFYQLMDVKSLIDAEMKMRKGRVMVTCKSEAFLVTFWVLMWIYSLCGPLD